MRSTLAIATIAAAAATVSAIDCNPSYKVAGSGECFTNCNIQAGKNYVDGWTMDPTSEKFLASLRIMCTKGTPEYLAFMTTAGICMSKCTDSPDLFSNEFSGACAWYALHKNDTCGFSTVTAEPSVATGISGAANSAHAAAGFGTKSSDAAASTETKASAGNSIQPMLLGYFAAAVGAAAYFGF